MTPRVAFGATPLQGGQHLRPGKAGSAVFLGRCRLTRSGTTHHRNENHDRP
jgi:hypothetical protein